MLALTTLQVMLKPLQGDIQAIHAGLAQGGRFSEQVAPYIANGLRVELEFIEVHGKLVEFLRVAGEREHAKFQQLQKLKQLLYYPIVLLVILICSAVGIMKFILPQMAQLQSASPFNWHMNMITVAGIGFLLVGIAITIMGWWRFKRCSPLKRIQKLQRMPLIGKLICHYLGYRICLQLGLLLISGMSLAAVVKQLESHDKMSKLMVEINTQATEYLANGHSLLDLVQSLKVLPETTNILFQQGKSQILIGRDLQQTAASEFSEFQRLATRLISLVQPLCFGLIAILVVLVYLMMLLPMYHNLGGMMEW